MGTAANQRCATMGTVPIVAGVHIERSRAFPGAERFQEQSVFRNIKFPAAERFQEQSVFRNIKFPAAVQ
jgi:hypothetical protein